MSKKKHGNGIVSIDREGDHFDMIVRIDGERERWSYERLETSTGVSFILIGREHL